MMTRDSNPFSPIPQRRVEYFSFTFWWGQKGPLSEWRRLRSRPRRRRPAPPWLAERARGRWAFAITFKSHSLRLTRSLLVLDVQKWSKGKVREKLQNAVMFDQKLYDRLVAEVPKVGSIGGSSPSLSNGATIASCPLSSSDEAYYYVDCCGPPQDQWKSCTRW